MSPGPSATDDPNVNDQLEVLRAMRARALEGGGLERIATQHARGKLTARERLALLLDDGSFQEMGALATHDETEFGLAEQRYPGDGVVAGFGKINGRRVAAFAQDFTVLGGSFSRVQSHKISRIQDLALESGVPIVGLNDSGGARIQEGVASLAAYGEVFVRNVLSSGVIPRSRYCSPSWKYSRCAFRRSASRGCFGSSIAATLAL